MAIMKIPYNGEWVIINDPEAERLIYKTDTEPENAVEGSIWISSDSLSATGEEVGYTTAISLTPSNWEDHEDGNYYTKEVAVNGLTSSHLIYLMPDLDTLNALHSIGCEISITNTIDDTADEKTVTAYCYGFLPAETITIPITYLQVEKGLSTLSSNTIGSSIQWDTWS